MPRIEFNAPVTLLYAAAAMTMTLTGSILPLNGLLAVHGPISLQPEFILSLLTWTLAHANMGHLTANFVSILLTGPVLEQRYGSARMAVVYVLSSVFVGLAHCLIAPGSALIGASGTAFLCIMMTAIASGRSGALPVSFLLIAGLHFAQEIVAMLSPDRISQSAHMLGGVLGVVLGLAFADRSVRTAAR